MFSPTYASERGAMTEVEEKRPDPSTPKWESAEHKRTEIFVGPLKPRR
jgi:hypothetical protein